MTRYECDELCLALQRNYSGAHAHTASKAAFYLRRLADKPNARFSNCTQDKFISTVRHALALNEWQQLRELMGGWF